MKKVVVFHLYSDFSGSPKVLKNILENLLNKKIQIDLITSEGGELAELNSSELLKTKKYRYKFSTNPFITFIRYVLVQLYTFFLAFKYLFQKDSVFYINTLLPVGPALAGFIMGKKVIYHYHENAKEKSAFYVFLSYIMQVIASKIICVSFYQTKSLWKKKNMLVIPNALSLGFEKQFEVISGEKDMKDKNILMLSSLKKYKGVIDFIYLSHMLPEYSFELIINGSSEEIKDFLIENHLTTGDNITIYSSQKNVIPFYKNAYLLLNLTNPDYFVETFGLTALEAMTAGIPVIVPEVGGIAEYVEDDYNGYKINVSKLDLIAEKIRYLMNNTEKYRYLSINAKKTSLDFTNEKLINRIIDVLK